MKNKTIIVNILIVLLISWALLLINNLINSKHYIEICYEADNNGTMQIYFDKGEGFAETLSNKKDYYVTKKKEYIKFNIETGNYKNLRIDPIDHGDLDIKIYSINLVEKNISESLIDKNLTNLKGFINYSWENGVLLINDKITIDPQIVLNYDKSIIIDSKNNIYITLIIISLVLFFLLKKYVSITFLRKYGWIYFVLFIVYFIFTQWEFVFRTDVYAEAFPQYVYKFKNLDFYKIIEINNYGYLGILPSFLTYMYILFDFPLGHIDYYFKIVILSFVFISLYFVFSEKTNNLFLNPILKFLFSILLISFLDFTIFSFINIWYVGFISIIFISLSLITIKDKTILFLYTIFASFVILSKPPLFILPIIVYALYNKKNIVSNILLLLLFSFIQVISLLLHASTVVNGVKLTESFIDKVYNTFEAFYYFTIKFLSIQPNMLVFILFTMFLIIGVYRKGGIILVLTLAASIFAGCFLFANAPDFKMNNYYEILNYPFNTRSFPILILLLVVTFISIHSFLIWVESFEIKSNYKKLQSLFIILVVVFFASRNYFYNKVNNSTLEYTNVIENFREDLTLRNDICMPVAPYGNWMYVIDEQKPCKIENKDRVYNIDEPIDLFKNKYIINIDKNIILKTLLIPIKKIDNFDDGVAKLILIDNDSNEVYEAYSDNIYNDRGFIAFNLSNIVKKESYHFTLYSLTDNTYGFLFSDDKKMLVHYVYYKN